MMIKYLADHPNFLPLLARWHHKEWSYLRPGETLEARMDRLREACGHEEIPTVFVAVADGKLLGSAMLLDHDMHSRMELTPWLAGVFVAPNERGRGVGSALVSRAVECAGKLGVNRLYLYTPSAESLYARLGWSAIERTDYRGANVVVMSYDMSRRHVKGGSKIRSQRSNSSKR